MNVMTNNNWVGPQPRLWFAEQGYQVFITISHMPTEQVVGVGKERNTLIGQWGYLKRQPECYLSYHGANGPVPADSRW